MDTSDVAAFRLQMPRTESVTSSARTLSQPTRASLHKLRHSHLAFPMQRLETCCKPKLERYGGSKVRTGCMTCKQRRVKCDEGKPTCNRCKKAGRVCRGYIVPTPKHHNTPGQPLVIISYVAPDNSLSFFTGIGSREKRSLEFFRTQTVLEVFPAPDWPEHLLRTSCYEDAIRHAIVALGALHEHYSVTSEMDEDFAMEQYSKAMKQVMKLDMKGSASTDVALISCILFACFESLQGHFRSSLLHVNSGLQILKEQEMSDVASKKTFYVSKEDLRPLFLRFVTQSREIGDAAVSLVYDSLPASAQDSVSNINTFDDAHNSLSLYLHEFVVFLGSLEPDPDRDLSGLQAIVEQHRALTFRHLAWCKAFDKFLEAGPKATESGIAKLQVWRTVIDITISLDIALGERAWDNKAELFRKLVGFTEIIVQHQPRGYHSNGRRTTSIQVSGPHLPGISPRDHHDDQIQSEDDTVSEINYCQTMSALRPMFSLDLGIIAPLYIVVSRCRDPAIRRQGLQILASCNRREGIWDSTLTARVAERIIAIEEEGAISHPVLYASQIPEHARIRDLTVKFSMNRESLIRYTKSVDSVGPNDKYEELLEW